MGRANNLEKRLKIISDIIDPPAIQKYVLVIRSDAGYSCNDLKIKEPGEKKIINQALKKASKKRSLYIVVLDLRSDNLEDKSQMSMD